MKTKTAIALVSLALLTADVAQAHDACGSDEHEEERDALREIAAKRVSWHSKHRRSGKEAHVQLLGFNDFHGQLSAGRVVATRPVGGAAVLASYLRDESKRFHGDSLIVHAGDHVGASPPASALLRDEPAIEFLNLLANDRCRYRAWAQPHCNVVGTLGNHEFDDGKDELLRLLDGGNHAEGPFLESPWRGARVPYVNANVVDDVSGQPILPPYVVQELSGVRVAIIGAVLEATPTIVTPAGVAGLRFLDEAEAINRYVAEVRRRGVETIVVTIHQGGSQPSYQGGTNPTSTGPGGEIADIISRLDDAVDVVVSGHAHSFTNALMKTRSGHEILVTQAFSASTAYSDIELVIDRATRDVVAKSAAIVTTFADAGPGLHPEADVADLVARAEQAVAPLVMREVGTAAADITRTQNAAGESALGNLIADAQRASVGAQIAFMNPGGIRADLGAGTITWGELFTIQPFANDVIALDLTGADVLALLEQQWQLPTARILQVSGLTYRWDGARPVGSRVAQVLVAGAPLELGATYRVAVNSFLATGGDGFTVLTRGTNRVVGPVDLDALVDFIAALGGPVTAALEGRIVSP